MRVLYDIGIGFYALILRIISPFHPKAKRWVQGRKGLLKSIEQTVEQGQNPIWFHFASLGEFEQGRSVMERIREKYPNEKILITFFSPSGYDIRKNTPLADYVFYLPIDKARNAKLFLDTVRPKFAVFTKYEYWYHYFRELNRREIPLFMVSAIFRKEQIFFKWYGGFFRSILKRVTFFFAQNMDSVYWLKAIHITKAGLAGDTRFDRVLALPKQKRQIPEVETFVDGAAKVLVAGSTWPEDEKLLVELFKAKQEWKVILAPHEIDEGHLQQIVSLFPAALFFSKFQHYSAAHIAEANLLVIDNIGMLSSLYGYGAVAYIGGGFGTGIHNTLEAATYGVPVLFGPRYSKFQEAKDLIERGGAFSIDTAGKLIELLTALADSQKHKRAGAQARTYVTENAGATQIIMKYLETQRLL